MQALLVSQSVSQSVRVIHLYDTKVEQAKKSQVIKIKQKEKIKKRKKENK